MTSIKSYLISWILGIVITAIVIISYISYTGTKHEIEELFDAELVKTAKIFLQFIDFDENKSLSVKQVGYLSHKLLNNTVASMPSHEYEGKIAFQIYNSQYKLLLESHNSPNFFPKQLQEGFMTQIIDREKWNLFILKEKNSNLWLVTAQHNQIRQELIQQILLGLLIPSLIGTPILIILIWLFLARGLKPLDVIASAISKRQPEYLELIHLQHVPDEIQPIIKSLNHLFDRLRKTLEREKRFTADAAHELRTPLSILKIHAQNAQAAETKEGVQRSLAILLHGVDKSTHLVEQLLKLARLEPDSIDNIKFKNENITHLLKEEYAFNVPGALNKNQNIDIHLPEKDIYAKVNGISFSLLIRNLLENAIQYCPQEGEIEVKLDLEKDRSKFSLSIKNSGEKIPQESKDRLFERFYRINPGTSKGSGLGLSIVRQCADIHQAKITLSETTSGLHLIVSFLN